MIGTANLAVNSSVTFTNPADNQMSILIHLPNGNFVAYEAACTHQQVPVAYNPGNQTLTCPAHNRTVLHNPATRPLPGVAIRVNADGTVTTG